MSDVAMALFQKLMALRPLQSYLDLEDEIFVEEEGWRHVLGRVRELKHAENIEKIVYQAQPVREKEKLILGYLCTLAAEMAEAPVELPCVEYGGCYLGRGELRLHNRKKGYYPSHLGMGMNATSPETKIVIEGDVGDYLGYRSPRASIEVTGSARDSVGMALGQGRVRVEGDILGGLAGHSQNARFEIVGSVGRINGENVGCTFLIEEDVQEDIAGDQADCFIKVAGSVGVENKKATRSKDIAAGLTRNTIVLVGGDVHGNLGKDFGVGKVFVWGRVYGEIHTSGAQGGFIYLNKKRVPLFQRIKDLFGGDIGIKYVVLKESGYLFAEGPDDVKEIVKG